MPRDKLAILGTGVTLKEAPWKDPTFEFYGLGYQWGKVPRLDAAFEIHDAEECHKIGIWPTLQTVDCPLYMQQRYPDVPASQAYPIHAVTAMFALPHRPKLFATGTPTYMLAFALALERSWVEIHCYGVDLQTGHEYESQLRSVEFFLGVAMGRGIQVRVPATSALLKTAYRYGYDAREQQLAVADLTQRIEHFTAQRDRAAEDEAAARTVRQKYDALIANETLHRKRAQL